MDALEFKNRMRQLPRPITDKKPPYWEAWRLNLYDWIMENDPADFCKCPAVHHCMLVEHWQKPILYELSVVSDFMPLFGKEIGLPEYHNLIHQAYHLYQWEQVTGRRIKDQSTIVEFGGGYGAMALLARRLGFTGRYVIYDLPEFSLLQEWYLSQHGVEAEWNPKHKPRNVDLFMGLYSLSEIVPVDRLEKTIKSKSYLFLYSGMWELWNNSTFFQMVIPSQYDFRELRWRHIELTHLPDKNNWYSIGW